MTIYTLYWMRDKTHTDPYTEGYIGITSRDPQIRLREHRNKKALTQDVILDILYEVESEEEVLLLENKYRPEPDIGWNSYSGGRHYGNHSEKSKLKMSITRKGRPSHRKGKKLSKEHARKISESNSKSRNNDKKKRAVIADGIRYESLTAYGKTIGITYSSVYNRIRSNNYDCKYEE